MGDIPLVHNKHTFKLLIQKKKIKREKKRSTHCYQNESQPFHFSCKRYNKILQVSPRKQLWGMKEENKEQGRRWKCI